jgi:hypothetical protein
MPRNTYSRQDVVGGFFENVVMWLLDLRKTHDKSLPDLESMDNSFYVEVKASAYNNGGVIKGKQLNKFDSNINSRRFYAFPYHSISRNMRHDYPTKKKLTAALDLRSLYLFPFSVVKAYYENSEKKPYNLDDNFVQLLENKADRIFNFEGDVWKSLGLDKKEYRADRPHRKVHILTRGGLLGDDIVASLDLTSRYLGSYSTERSGSAV